MTMARATVLGAMGAAFLLIALPSRAEACSCMAQSAEEAFESSAAVFEGRVTSIEGPQGPIGGGGQVKVSLDVVRVWKGLDTDRETVEVVTADNSAACGYNFEPSRSYLVYTHEQDGVQHVSLCSNTKPIEDADAEMSALGEGITPVNPVAPPEEQTSAATPPAAPSNGSGGGCASCSVGTRTHEEGAPLLVSAVLLALALRRSRRA